MILGRFQRLKCAFGTSAAANTPSLKLDVPGLKPGPDLPEAEVYDGQMSISWYVAGAFANSVHGDS
jgi:hypothetical protein